MKFQDILREFEIKKNNPHFDHRAYQRCFGQDYYDVIASRKTDPPKNNKIIGRYNIPPEAKTRIKSILDYIDKPYFWAEHGNLFIIELFDFKMKTEYVNFYGDQNEQRRNYQIFRDRDNMNVELQEHPLPDELSTPQSLSMGHYLVCYVVDNYLTTMFLSRTSYPPALIDKARKNNPKKNIIFIRDPFTELDAYMDIDKAREFHSTPEKPEEPPPPPEEPQLSDKEKRLQAYKEKQQRLWKYKK